MSVPAQTTSLNRRITYLNQLASSTYALEDQTEDMIEKGKIISAFLGTNTWVDGFACTPTAPASLAVEIAPGTVYQNLDVDTTDFGEAPSSIDADTDHQVMKVAINLDNASNITFVAPATPGFSRNDLIQVTIDEVDGDNQNIPFWNGINPLVNLPNPPIFQNKNVHRICEVNITRKAGTPAATGTQATPTPDSGNVGLWVVTVANGQTTITSGDIVAYEQYSGDPDFGVSNPTAFLDEKLPQKLSKATADTLYAPLSGHGALFGLDGNGLRGFKIVNNVSLPLSSLDFNPGTCMDSTNTTVFSLAATLTKSIASNWVVGNNQGGLFTGTVAADTTYHLFAILKDSDGSVDCGFDTSITAANRPAGYTLFRRVASWYTDSSANLIQAYNNGDDFILQTPALDLIPIANPGTSAILVPLSIPVGLKLRGLITPSAVLATLSATAHIIVSDPDALDVAPSSAARTFQIIGTGATSASQIYGSFITDTSGRVRIRTDFSDGTTELELVTRGWVDDRGRFA